MLNKCLSNWSSYALFLPLKPSLLGKQDAQWGQRTESLGKALTLHVPQCVTCCSHWLRSMLNTGAWRSDSWQHHLCDCMVTSSHCSPQGRWEGDQFSSKKHISVMHLRLVPEALFMGTRQKGKWEDEEPVSFQSFKTRRKIKGHLQKTHLPHLWTVCPVSNVLLVSVCEPLSFPLSAGRLFGICCPLRAGDLSRRRSHIVTVFSTPKWSHNRHLRQLLYHTVRHQRTCVT